MILQCLIGYLIFAVLVIAGMLWLPDDLDGQ